MFGARRKVLANRVVVAWLSVSLHNDRLLALLLRLADPRVWIVHVCIAVHYHLHGLDLLTSILHGIR